jgi:pullulanase/glycogen debranching enzyme
MKKQLFLLFSFLTTATFLQAQILELNPAFPTVNDIVTVTYDATQGNATLVGQSQIYCHAGLITSASTSPTNWQFVQGNWGTVDPEVAMTNIGNNKHTITIDIDQFYGFPAGTNVLKLAFVFRNASGNIVGRAADGSDIYYDMYPANAGLLASFFHPSAGAILDINEVLSIDAAANQTSTLTLKEDGQILQTLTNATQLSYNLTATSAGTHLLEFIADNGTTQVIDSTYYTVNPIVVPQNPTYSNLQNGINYINDTTVVLQLHAPQKEHIYVIGDFNSWTPTTNYHMNLATNNTTWWLEITGLTAGQKYGYQYLIDGNMRFADPLSTLILDPNNDNNIGAATNPNPHPYPMGLTTGFVTIMQPGAQPYNWAVTNFTAPEKKDLVIYELLVRDFVAKRNYQTLIDTLDYLTKLGINAIELMPPGEFENNESWGYNPSFHMALDKYYGTPEKFKEFVDSCHARGIAVIVDMVLNHAFGQSPMVNMYWDAANNRPAANNPWFNAICPHEPYCWGYDYDHTRLAVQQYIDQVNRYWVETYNIDGFRFDYTKGFINNANGYSMERINLLKRMADEIWAFKPNAYIILEHWCDNSEEEQLADYGMMLWGNVTHGYQQALMGFPNASNISSGIYTNRGWSVPHLVSYAESHDEERTMFEALTYGNNTNSTHNARNLYTALGRAQALGVIFLTQPGPRMLWQFQELGYDISIDVPCRVCNKPILWNYYTQARRRQLYDVYAATLALRNEHETFRSLSFQYSLTGAVKRVNMNHSSMNGVSMANFATSTQSGIPSFQHAGWWYEYFTGDSINVTNALAPISLTAGEYRIYTDVKLAKPVITEAPVSVEELLVSAFELKVFPNPAQQSVNLGFTSLSIEPYDILLLNEAGQVVVQKRGTTAIGNNQIDFNLEILSAGSYHFLVKVGNAMANEGFIKVE